MKEKALIHIWNADLLNQDKMTDFHFFPEKDIFLRIGENDDGREGCTSKIRDYLCFHGKSW